MKRLDSWHLLSCLVDLDGVEDIDWTALDDEDWSDQKNQSQPVLAQGSKSEGRGVEEVEKVVVFVGCEAETANDTGDPFPFESEHESEQDDDEPMEGGLPSEDLSERENPQVEGLDDGS